jgi:hypothetical protein
MAVPSRESIVGLVSRISGVPVSELTDDRVIGLLLLDTGAADFCATEFDKIINVHDVDTFNVGHLVRQIQGTD